jgi:hypothetical protein
MMLKLARAGSDLRTKDQHQNQESSTFFSPTLRTRAQDGGAHTLAVPNRTDIRRAAPQPSSPIQPDAYSLSKRQDH